MKHVISALLLVLASVYSWAGNTISFKHLSMQDGMSNNKVNNVYRDNMGFVWFSTSCGLNRYDGYTMTVFMHSDADSTSLPDNTVVSVTDIADDKLLVRTSHTYSIFDKRTETFHSAQYIFDAAHVRVWDAVVYADKYGDIWLTDGSACSVYSVKKDAVIQRALSGGSQSPIASICEGSGGTYLVHDDGTIAICTLDASGAWRVKTTETTPLGTDDPMLFIDSGGDYWVVLRNRLELWHKSAQTAQWTKLTTDTPEPYKSPGYVICGVVEDTDGRIWVASDHGGINVIDRRKAKVIEVRSQKSSGRSLVSNGISCIYADNQGCVWVGDVSMGVSYFAEPMFKFSIDNLQIDDIDPNFVAQVNTIAEDGKGSIYYGTNENGLLRIDKDGKKRLFRTSNNDNSLSSDIVVSLCPDDKGGLWIGTFLGGLCHYDGNNHFTRYHNAPGIADAASADNVWAVCQEDDHLWIGALAKGLAILDMKSNTWKQLCQSSGLPNNFVRKIVSLHDGRMAIGTANGLCVIDSRKDYEITTIDASLLPNGAVTDLYYDSRDILWVCGNDGLNAFDGKTLKPLTHIGQQDGLPSDATLAVTEDMNRALWVATASGMTSIDVMKDERNSTLNTNLYSYNDQDGFFGNSVNERAIACTSDGSIIVGGANGVNIFNPTDISYNKERPFVHFTSISTFGKPAPIASHSTTDFSIPQALPFTDAIEMPYNVNMFTISFSTLSNVLPEKVTYTYMLKGFNNNWITTRDNYATYTNLAPGHYTLIVRAANCDGLPSIDDATLSISILPPWWRTIWAYIIYAIAIIAAIFFSIKWIRDRDKAKYQMRQMVSEVEKQKQLDDMKLRFFTNISHELRTPLSLIISPLENILDQMPPSDDKRPQIELIHRNAQKLLGMVNQLLDFRKADKGGMTLNLSEGDMVGFASELSDTFVKLSAKDIHFSLNASEPNIYMKFDKDKMSKVVNNLLSNAYKFTPPGGSVTLSVSLSPDHQKAIISVTDTGIGIPDEHKAHVFERFYQVPQSDASLAGSGIGLHLVKEFVTMHNGDIRVEDNPNGGSIFTVEIPTSLGLPSDSIDTTDNDDAEPIPESSRLKIAIVDDNDDFLTLLRDTLKSDYDIIEAHNGSEAYSKIVAEVPNLIISDVMMPIMDGNQLCAKVKNDIRISHIPFIMLTAKTAEEHNIEGLTNGADDYLTKPFNPQILRLKIKKLIELGQKRHEMFKNQIDPEPSEITITPLDEQLIQKAISYVEDNISSPNLSVEDLSRHLGMSRVHLYKKLVSITGRPPIEFIRVIRVKRAAQMLRDPQQNVSDVAYAVGFNNPKYFSKYFKEEFGVLPSKYNATLQNPDNNDNATV